jgi:hypothetical protein
MPGADKGKESSDGGNEGEEQGAEEKRFPRVEGPPDNPADAHSPTKLGEREGDEKEKGSDYRRSAQELVTTTGSSIKKKAG